VSAHLSDHGRPEVSVAAVDADRMLLDGLRAWLAAVPAVRLVAAVPTVAQLLGLAPAAAVDVVLLDLFLADKSSPPDNLARLVAAGHRVLVVSACSVPARLTATLAAGARGYLTKDHDLADLVAAIREVATAGTSFSPELAVACLRDDRPDRPPLSPADRAVLAALGAGMHLDEAAHSLQLTPDAVRGQLSRITAGYHRAGIRHPGRVAALSTREREVALLIRDGMTNAQIARRLGVTTKTVEKHASNSMVKLGVSSRAGVAVRVGQDGWAR
jgi:DNA-binding NarL/FixJ family response regulator